MVSYRFTAQAECDLEDIVDYTVEHFGSAQAHLYIDGLQTLAENPDMGSVRGDASQSLLSFPYISHVIYYLKDSQGITIIRVLHPRMDVERHIDP